jgi:transposase
MRTCPPEVAAARDRYAFRGIHLPRPTLDQWKLAASELLIVLPTAAAPQLSRPCMYVEGRI